MPLECCARGIEASAIAPATRTRGLTLRTARIVVLAMLRRALRVQQVRGESIELFGLGDE